MHYNVASPNFHTKHRNLEQVITGHLSSLLTASADQLNQRKLFPAPQSTGLVSGLWLVLLTLRPLR